MTQAWVQIRDHPVCDRCLGLDIGGVVRVPQEEIRLAGPEQAEIVCFCRGWEGECERVQRAGQGVVRPTRARQPPAQAQLVSTRLALRKAKPHP